MIKENEKTKENQRERPCCNIRTQFAKHSLVFHRKSYLPIVFPRSILNKESPISFQFYLFDKSFKNYIYTEKKIIWFV